jgi:hypothetical protein
MGNCWRLPCMKSPLRGADEMFDIATDLVVFLDLTIIAEVVHEHLNAELG